MKIKQLPIGLEMYSVRDDYARDALGTLKAISAMGYQAVELFGGEGNNLPAPQANEYLEQCGLSCCSYQPNWEFVQEATFERTLRFAEEMKTKWIGVAMAPPEMLTHREGVDAVIRHLNRINDIAVAAGFTLGYHAHKTDFVTVDGKTAWDRIFEETPDSFTMVLDTGNALAGGAWSVPLLRKFPDRSPWVHIKPYSFEHQGATMIGEDAFDWPELLASCVKDGGAQILIVEYSNNARYQPLEAVDLCAQKLLGYMA